MICHEIRNPLSGILNNVDLLRMGISERNEIYQKLSTLDVELESAAFAQLKEDINAIFAIEACAKHQRVMTDDVLNLSKLRSNRIVLNPVVMRVRGVVKGVLGMFEAEADKKGIILEALWRDGRDGRPHDWMCLEDSDMEIGAVPLMLDPDRLAQVRVV